MSKFLMSLSPESFSGRPIFVQGNVILSLGVSVLVEGRGIGVIPVFFKLLAENTLPCELLLCEQEVERKKREM